MAERSTAAVGVAETSGEDEKPLPVREDGATSDGATDARPSGEDESAEPTEPSSRQRHRPQSRKPKPEPEPDSPEPAPGSGSDGKPGADSDAETETAAAADSGGAADTKAATRPRTHGKPRSQAKADGAAGPHGEGPAPLPELHSGHKLAQRYRLEECVTRLDGFSSWRAVDEKLRRAVGVHVLPAAHPRARQVLAAARSAALLGDPRFVQVLDAVEDGQLVYVVHEWLPDATSLDELLATGPLEPHEAYQLVLQLSQGLAAAHREGLAHLRLTPPCVLRTATGQYRVRGLAVNAALRGVTSDHGQRDDTEAIGALLYASLTQRWPYENGAHGLPGVGTLTKDTLAPDQLRAGVHRGLSALAMRALVNDGATASRQEQPCATPEELARAAAAMPRIRPPETAFAPPPAPYQPGGYPQPTVGGQGRVAPHPPGAAAHPAAEPPAPPALPGRTGKVLKWGVSALLIAALGLGSWQIADALLKGESPQDGPEKSEQRQPAGGRDSQPSGKPLKIVGAKDFDPESSDGSENPDKVPDAYDGDPQTYWLTSKYFGRPDFGNLKSGVGLIFDLGSAKRVSTLKADFMGKTSASFLAAPQNVTSMPSSLSSFSKVTSGSGDHLSLTAKKPIKTRFVLLWLTKLPMSDDGNYRGRVTEVQVVG
ncbi:protein kinase family protein [Streptomyces boncukensis]|uniref:Serine/threonine protein kinase n=1 Tax=Streptomyces boncukensis TaxID=2711219 RepID=A0A6G4X0K7_9ACTN|nr:hypothetical protein [Streptomyces boncukensis]